MQRVDSLLVHVLGISVQSLVVMQPDLGPLACMGSEAPTATFVPRACRRCGRPHSRQQIESVRRLAPT